MHAHMTPFFLISNFTCSHDPLQLLLVNFEFSMGFFLYISNSILSEGTKGSNLRIQEGHPIRKKKNNTNLEICKN